MEQGVLIARNEDRLAESIFTEGGPNQERRHLPRSFQPLRNEIPLVTNPEIAAIKARGIDAQPIHMWHVLRRSGSSC